MKKGKSVLGLFIYLLVFVGIIGTVILISYYMSHDHSFNNDVSVVENKNGSTSEKINEFKSKLDNIILENDFDNKYSFIFTKDNEQYNAYYFDYESGKQIKLDDLIKDGFWDKVNLLLKLKYPKFITDVLEKHDKNNVVVFNEDEAIIYYYDYEINPLVNDTLSVKLNYNEIGDFLNFNVKKSSQYQNELYSDYNENCHYVALTFDDGPGQFTERLINILNNNKVKSTFFIISNKIEKNFNILKYMQESGHEIGYHSLGHKNFKNDSLDKIKEDYDYSNKLLNDKLNISFNLVRPPYGEYNKDILNKLNLPFILWSVDTLDWKKRDAMYLYDYLLNNLKSGDIVLLHDIHESTVDGIEKVLPLLYTKGYRFVTVSDLAKINNVTLKNGCVYRHLAK